MSFGQDDIAKLEEIFKEIDEKLGFLFSKKDDNTERIIKEYGRKMCQVEAGRFPTDFKEIIGPYIGRIGWRLMTAADILAHRASLNATEWFVPYEVKAGASKPDAKMYRFGLVDNDGNSRVAAWIVLYIE